MLLGCKKIGSWFQKQEGDQLKDVCCGPSLPKVLQLNVKGLTTIKFCFICAVESKSVKTDQLQF